MSGTLQITIISAKLTHDTETFGKMDPFCVLKFKASNKRTKTHKDAGKFPSWNEIINVRKEELAEVIELEVWDEDSLSKNDLIGIGFLNADALTKALARNETFFPINYKGKAAGEVLIAYQFFPDAVPQENPYSNLNQYQPYPQPQPYPYPYGYPPQNYGPGPYPPQPYIPGQPNPQPQLVEPVKPNLPEPNQKPNIPSPQKIAVPIEEVKEKLPELKEKKFKFEKDEELDGSENMNVLYLKSNIDRKIVSVSKITIKGKTKDQGYASVDGSSSWIEAAVVVNGEEITGRSRIFENYCLSDYKSWKTKIEENQFLDGLQRPGAQICLWARSQYPGWICSVQWLKISIKCFVEE